MARIIVTGGSGFIGTNAVEHFFNRGDKVLNLDIKPPQNGAHYPYWVKCDILNLEMYQEVAVSFDPEFWVHLAARTDLHETQSIDGYITNTVGVSNTIKVISQCPHVAHAIFASSRMVCRIGYQPTSDEDYCPPNLYGESKVLGERMVRNCQIMAGWTIVRPTSIWGPWFDVPYRLFFDSVRRGNYVQPKGLNPEKSFGYVGNTVFQIARLLTTPRQLVDKKVIYLCDYPPLHLLQWANLVSKQFGRNGIVEVPLVLLKAAASVGDVAYRLGWLRVPLTSFRLSNLVCPMLHETATLESVCGPLPYSLEEGVRLTISWMRSHKTHENAK